MNETDLNKLIEFLNQGLITPDQKRRIERRLEKGLSLREAIQETPIIDPIKLQVRLSSIEVQKPEFPENENEEVQSQTKDFLNPSLDIQKTFLSLVEDAPTLNLKMEDVQIKAMENMIQTLQGFVGLPDANFQLKENEGQFTWLICGQNGNEWSHVEFSEKDGRRFLLQLCIAARISPHTDGNQEAVLKMEMQKSVPFLLRTENASDHLYGFRLAESV